MANSIFITATQPGSGKSAIAMGLVNHLERLLGRVAFFKPIGQNQEMGPDPDAQLMKTALGLEYEVEEMVAVTMDEVVEALSKGTYDQLMDTILTAFQKLSDNADYVVCEGTDYFGTMASLEFDINAELSKNLGAPVLLVANMTKVDSNAEDLLNNIGVVKESLDEKSCDLFGVVINRIPTKDLNRINDLAEESLRQRDIRLLGSIPRIHLLENPSIEEIATALKADVISGHQRLNVVVRNVAIAAMTLENVLKKIPKGSLIIVPGDREDILLGMAAAYVSPTVPSPSGVIMTGGMRPREQVNKLFLDITQEKMPVLSVKKDTYPAAIEISAVKPKLVAHHRPRIEAVKSLVERYIDTDPLLAHSALDNSSMKMTPKKFIHRIMALAKGDKKHIVLAEGFEPRILKAANVLLTRGIVDLTLIGDEAKIRDRVARMGLQLNGAQIINPKISKDREPFAKRYIELRSPRKNPTWEFSYDLMSDPIYFATMMVHEGQADGMVAGSITTTANTLRPALEFIKTKDNVSIASSIFFMCLPDSVLVYGDCAVNPNPSAEHLADIALASAATAKAFEIKPVVAMLSYSTGESGTGSDVEKVRKATKLVRAAQPSLLIEGPIQYDAAIDPSVAKTKLPKSRVAGSATVFIFPDLDSGNNTYKAVQRSAKAIAIGPVMQGLRKPVNDLSRGCTVPDIVNTVAITAIQAQIND